MIVNQNNLQDIEMASSDIKNIAFNVKNNAEEMRKEAAKRNCRVMMIIACFCVALLIFIIVMAAKK